MSLAPRTATAESPYDFSRRWILKIDEEEKRP